MEQSKFWNALLLAVSTGMEILSLIWDHGIVISVIGKKICGLCDLWADELTSATFQLCVPDPCSRVSSLHHMGYVTRHSLEPRKGNSKAIMTVFDPGGVLVYYNGCGPFEHNRCCHSCKCNGNHSYYDCWLDKLNVVLVYKQTMIVFVVSLLVIAGLAREGNDSHISRKVWADRVSSWYCYGAIELGVKQGIYNIEVDEVSAAQNDDMGSQLLPLTMGLLGKFDCDSTAGMLVQRVHYEYFGRTIITLAYTEHLLCSLLDINNLVFRKAAIQRMRSLEVIYHLFDEGPEQLPFGQSNGDVIHESNIVPANSSSGIIVASQNGLEKGNWELYVTVKRNYLEGRFSSGYKNVLLMVIILESFVWDPGLGANFFLSFHTCSIGAILVRILYILGDKDGFEGEGKRMLCIEEDMQKGRHNGLYW